MTTKRPAKKTAKKTAKRTIPRTQKIKQADPQGPLRVDLACGQRLEEGWVGVDIAPLPGVQIVHNLEEHPWPIASDSVDEVRCSHFVEHVHDLIGFMNDLHRIMKPGAQANIVTPYYTSVRAFQDPTHVRFISEHSYLYFNQEWLRNNGLDHYGITADFDFGYGYQITDPTWQSRNEEARLFAIRHYWNIVDDLIVTLTKR